KVDANAGIIIGDRRQRAALVVDANEGKDEFVGDPLIVGLLDSLHRVDVGPAVALAVDHRVVGFLRALPPLIAIHGVITSGDAGNFADAVFANLLLQLFHESGATVRGSIAAIHKTMDVHTLDTLLLAHLKQRVEVRVHGMHTAVGDKAKDMQLTSPGSS